MSNRTLRAYERWAATYDHDANPQTLLERRQVLAALGPSAGETILDAACGTGCYAQLCVDAGCTVVGIDFSPSMLAVARRRVPLAEFLLADLNRSLPLASERFDAVVCAQALKHLPQPRPVLSEFGRVLRPGGRCVVSVTHPEMDWSGYAMRDQPRFILSAEADIHHHRLIDYERAFAQAGLENLEIRPVCIDEQIRHLLTDESYRLVAGRPQVAVFIAGKPGGQWAGDNPPLHWTAAAER